MTLQSETCASIGFVILTTIVRVYLVSCISIAIYNIFFHPLAKYPGPTLRAAFHFPDAFSKLRGTSYTDTKYLHDQYGTVVRLVPDGLSYNVPRAWKDIYGVKQDRSELGKDPAFYKRAGGVHILNANQEEHARIRKMLAPAFSDSALLAQEPLLTYYFDLLVSKLKSKVDGPGEKRVDMMAYYNFTTFDIVGDLVLGEPFGALEGGQYHTWIRNVFESIKMLGWIRLAFNYPAVGIVFSILQKVVPSFAQKREQHMKFTEERLRKRLNLNTARKDIVAYINSDNDEHVGLSYVEILGNSRILLTAGSETTATHLSGATWYLLTHREILRRVQDEVRAAFTTADEITLRSVSIPGRLPYLEAVIQESFRLYPSVPAALPRVTGPEGAFIDGRFVPGNVSVGVHQWSTYRHAGNFARPDEFLPERWLADAPEEFKDDRKDALQPFLLGPRGCLGKSLAYFEIRSILTHMLWHFEMRLEDESWNWLDGQREFTLWDKPGLWVRVDHRRG
ncbi:hypothetical protein HYFRA_00008199 [Hymenoscyphus fraxineus]|uniref:Cytochrome P450 n=1 Tax=Hymenoscyphus fraxineus TaxID=746836 RepID=A0A9N9LA48_9HELO|nr:hypothetical protein HYFRA_00008199 [Hymenoscyphus fraxineus]